MSGSVYLSNYSQKDIRRVKESLYPITASELDVLLTDRGNTNMAVWGSSNVSISGEGYGIVDLKHQTFGLSGHGRAIRITTEESDAHFERYLEVLLNFSMDTAVFDNVDIGYLTKARTILERPDMVILHREDPQLTLDVLADSILATIDSDVKVLSAFNEDSRDLYWWLYANAVELGMESISSIGHNLKDIEDMDDKQLKPYIQLLKDRVKAGARKAIVAM